MLLAPKVHNRALCTQPRQHCRRSVAASSSSSSFNGKAIAMSISPIKGHSRRVLVIEAPVAGNHLRRRVGSIMLISKERSTRRRPSAGYGTRSTGRHADRVETSSVEQPSKPTRTRRTHKQTFENATLFWPTSEEQEEMTRSCASAVWLIHVTATQNYGCLMRKPPRENLCLYTEHQHGMVPPRTASHTTEHRRISVGKYNQQHAAVQLARAHGPRHLTFGEALARILIYAYSPIMSSRSSSSSPPSSPS